MPYSAPGLVAQAAENDQEMDGSCESGGLDPGGDGSSFAVVDEDFCVYFELRGGVPVFGQPISRPFTLLGYEVQMFQRRVIARIPGGLGVAQLRLLGTELFPYRSVNFSTLPPVDPELLARAPDRADPDFLARARALVEDNVSDDAFGMPVNFRREYFGGAESDGGRSFANSLRIWGLPRGRPTLDPNNTGFVYERFQYGTMMYDDATGVTGEIPLGEYLKMIITGRDLPVDLAESAAGSPLYAQYSSSSTAGVDRPWELPATDLSRAFEADR
jgi:hypothetical protein